MKNPNHNRGNLINFPGDCGMLTADILTVKLLLKGVISTSGAKFKCKDVQNFYLNTPMEIYVYFQMKLKDIPANVIEEYKLKDKKKDGYICNEVRKGMYGLPQAGLIPQEL